MEEKYFLANTTHAFDNLNFEIGGNNIAGRSYVSIPGSGRIGSLYYCGAKIAF